MMPRIGCRHRKHVADDDLNDVVSSALISVNLFHTNSLLRSESASNAASDHEYGSSSLSSPNVSMITSRASAPLLSMSSPLCLLQMLSMHRVLTTSVTLYSATLAAASFAALALMSRSSWMP